jgi:hypothetical protein
MSVILVAVDGSSRSERALDHVAERLRGRPGARAELLYVHEPAVRYGRLLAMQRDEALEALRERRAADVLRLSGARLEAAGVPAGTHVAHGELYSTIARRAVEVSASEIVLGVRTPWLARLAAALARRVRPIEVLHVPVTYAS